MKFLSTTLPSVTIVEPRIFSDSRGEFFESFNAKGFTNFLGSDGKFVQDNQSTSHKGVLRGIHYQIKQAQGKLVRVLTGSIYDIAVDLRKSSPTFGKSFGIELSAENNKMLWIPQGFGHAFLALENNTKVAYKTTDYWAPEFERTIIWDDPDLKISWPALQSPPILSDKDLRGEPLKKAELYD